MDKIKSARNYIIIGVVVVACFAVLFLISILRQYGKNSQVSYIGVDTDTFKPLHLKRENFVFSVGTCIPPKGYDFLEAIKRLYAKPDSLEPEGEKEDAESI